MCEVLIVGEREREKVEECSFPDGFSSGLVRLIARQFTTMRNNQYKTIFKQVNKVVSSYMNIFFLLEICLTVTFVQLCNK